MYLYSISKTECESAGLAEKIMYYKEDFVHEGQIHPGLAQEERRTLDFYFQSHL